jgi:hypothetical protein
MGCHWHRMHFFKIFFFFHTIAVLHMILTFGICLKISLCMWCHWQSMHCAWHHMHCACSVNDTAYILKNLNYLWEFKFIFEKALAP